MRSLILFAVVRSRHVAELVGQPHRRVVPRVRPVALVVLGVVLVDGVELGLGGRAEVVSAILVACSCHRLVLVTCVLVARQDSGAPLRATFQVRVIQLLELAYLIFLFFWVILVSIQITYSANFVACSIFSIPRLLIRRYSW